MRIRRFEDTDSIIEDINEIIQIEILDNWECIDWSIGQNDGTFKIDIDIPSWQIENNIEAISNSFNLAVKRIISMTGLSQAGRRGENEVLAFDDSDGNLGYFSVDWEYPFEQELLILMEDRAFKIKFMITLL